MKCPECQFDSSKESLFCSNCGHPMQSASTLSLKSSGVDDPGIEGGAKGDDDATLSKTDAKAWGAKPSASAPVVQIIQRTRFLVCGAIFYILLIGYLFAVLLFPQSGIARVSAVFENFWAQFIFLVLCLVGITLSLYGLFSIVCGEYLRSRWYQPKFGKVSVSERYITKEQLKAVLEEQELRIGEILLGSGRITQQQLDEALSHQRKDSGRLGEILEKMGYASEGDVYWALEKMQKKIGEIMMDRGLLTKEDVQWLLDQQKTGPRRI